MAPSPANNVEPVSAIAEFDRRNAELEDWRRLQPRLVEGLSSLAEYRQVTAHGRVQAALYLWNEGGVNPRAETLLETHRLIFQHATKDAGRFREAGEAITFGSNHGAEPMRIPVELQRLHVEMGELLAHATDRSDYCAAIAYYHARFVAIHPFLDGNGRAGRAVMEAQANLLGMHINLMHIADNKAAYIGALEASRSANDVGPLTSIVAQCVGHNLERGTPLLTAAQVKCRPMLNVDDIKTLAEERIMAGTGNPLSLPSVQLDHGKVAEAQKRAYVAALQTLRGEWLRESSAGREAIEKRAIPITYDLGGTDLTKIPLRVTAMEFIRGNTAADNVQKRLTEHFQHMPARTLGTRNKAQVLGHTL